MILGAVQLHSLIFINLPLDVLRWHLPVTLAFILVR